MIVRYATDFPAPASRRRTVTLLCVLVSHLGVFYWIATARFSSERHADEQRHDIELKFSIVPARPAHSTAMRQPAHLAARHVRQGNPAFPAAVAAMHQEAASPSSAAAAAPALDLDKLKQSAVSMALAEIRSKDMPESPAIEKDNAIGKAIGRASRPKCDNDYKPNIAGVNVDGLFKLPSLVGSALTDKGCKW